VCVCVFGYFGSPHEPGLACHMMWRRLGVCASTAGGAGRVGGCSCRSGIFIYQKLNGRGWREFQSHFLAYFPCG